MSYGEKLLYISAIEMVLKEKDPVKRDLYLDELIDISGRNGKTRETDVLERLKSNKDGMREYALKNGSGYIFREMLATSYEKGLRETTNVNMHMRTFGNYIVADDVIIVYTGKEAKVACYVRQEGLWHLEDKVIELKMTSCNWDLPEMLDMVADGTDPELFGDICMAKYYSEGYKDYAALTYLLCMQGALLIAGLENPYVLENKLIVMLPETLRKEYEADKANNPAAIGLYDMSRVERLREGDLPFKAADNGYLIAKLADCAIRSMDNTSIRRLLSDSDYGNLLICMRGLSGDARSRIFDNQSNRQSLMMADDLDHQDPVIVTAVIDAIDKMVRRMLVLMSRGILTYRENEAMELIYQLYKEENEENLNKKERLREVFDEYRTGGRQRLHRNTLRRGSPYYRRAYCCHAPQKDK